MFRLMIAVAAIFVSVGSASADEFFLSSDGVTVQRRVTSLEKRVAEIEKKLQAPKTIAESGPGTLDGSAKTLPLKPAKAKVRFQVCVNGQCAQGECEDLSQVPLGATVLSASQDCPCDTCVCPTGQCASGNCGVSAGVASAETFRAGLFQRVRHRRSAGCSSCR